MKESSLSQKKKKNKCHKVKMTEDTCNKLTDINDRGIE
jgi:hypothetical protein